jgi:hypothetical protein
MERSWFKIEEQATKDMGRTFARLDRSPTCQQDHLGRLGSINEIVAKRSGYPKGLLQKTDEEIGKFF